MNFNNLKNKLYEKCNNLKNKLYEKCNNLKNKLYENVMNRLLNFNKVKWVCHHLHIDKSNTVTKDLLNQSQVHMKEKWLLMRNIKEKIYIIWFREQNVKKQHQILLIKDVIK